MAEAPNRVGEHLLHDMPFDLVPVLSPALARGSLAIGCFDGCRLHQAGADSIDGDPGASQFFGQAQGQIHKGRFCCGIGRKARRRTGRFVTGKLNDPSEVVCLHLFTNALDQSHRGQHIAVVDRGPLLSCGGGPLVNTLRSEQIGPANVKHCPQS
jgi:hypothetical protein